MTLCIKGPYYTMQNIFMTLVLQEELSIWRFLGSNTEKNKQKILLLSIWIP